MKYIILTRGQQAIVDDSDFENMNSFKWCFSHGYAYRKIGPRGDQHTIYMHRMLLPTSAFVDHINGNRLDNRRSNLRAVTHQQNLQNATLSRRNKSGFKGVSWCKSRNKWRANIVVNKKQKSLGYFSTAVMAGAAYDQAAKIYFGEFARTS